jgi:hypothetical protein
MESQFGPIEPWCTCGAGEFQPPEAHVPPCPGALRDVDAGDARREDDKLEPPTGAGEGEGEGEGGGR